MLRLGEIQKCRIVRETAFGVYLAESAPGNPEPGQEGFRTGGAESGDEGVLRQKPEVRQGKNPGADGNLRNRREGTEHRREISSPDEVLLPRKQVPEGAGIGDEIEVFLYRDSSDRLISTVNKPRIRLNETALLTVKEIGKIGAFLDMGLERDLLLPFREQLYPLKPGDQALVAMYIDKSGRLAATTRVYRFLKSGSPYEKDDEVEGLLYEVSPKFGAFVAVDYRYSGLIPAREFSHEASPGDRVRARVVSVKEDGRLDLSLRKKSYLQMDDDGEAILSLMKAEGGRLPFTDKADPDRIREVFRMSKNAFKRAVGHLMKQGLVRMEETEIVCTGEEPGAASPRQDRAPKHGREPRGRH